MITIDFATALALLVTIFLASLILWTYIYFKSDCYDPSNYAQGWEDGWESGYGVAKESIRGMLAEYKENDSNTYEWAKEYIRFYEAQKAFIEDREFDE